MRILIVEDDAISRKLLQRRLEKWDHEVTAAPDGLVAWQEFQKGNYPIVISDWMMPGMDGLELTRRIRGLQNTGYTYIILLTAKLAKADLIQGMDAGADDFITKPFDPDEFRVRLRAGERIVELEKDLELRNIALEEANLRMHRDLDAAAKIQKSLLPAIPPEANGVRSAWYFQPCDQLAGDIFNVFKLDEDHLGIYVLDVSGHGVAASLWSVMLSRMLSPNFQQSGLLLKKDHKTGDLQIVPPAAVAGKLNRLFPVNPETGQFFTMLYGVLNLKNLEFRYVSAGQPDLLYLPFRREPKIIEFPSFPIGFNEEPGYEEKVIGLQGGDRIILYSDGVVEARRRGGEMYGKDRLIQALHHKKDQQLSSTLHGIMDDLSVWCGKKQYEDDITMVALEVKADA